MNEKFIHAFISKKQNKKIIIGDDPIQDPDGDVTMDEDCDRG